MKTHEEMTNNVFARIHAYEETKRARRTKIAMNAVPVCAVAVIGAGLWSLGVFRSDPGLLENRSAGSGEAPAVTELSAGAAQTVMQTTAKQTEPVTAAVQTENTDGQCVDPWEQQNGAVTADGTASEPYVVINTAISTTVPATDLPASSVTTTMTLPLKYTEPKSTITTTVPAFDSWVSTSASITTTVPAYDPRVFTTIPINFPGAFQGTDDPAVTRMPDYTLVYDYGEHTVRTLCPPRPYDILISEPLIQAMEHYGRNAPYHYLVTVDYFDSDGNMVHFSTEELQAEASRLADLVGYVGTAVETVNDQPPYLVLNGTMEEIQAFRAKDGYGCFLHLRDEAEYLIEE